MTTAQKQEFRTPNFVEAALLMMRLGSVRCEWAKGRGERCFFFFNASEEDIKHAKDPSATVNARRFDEAMRSIKSAMYAAKNG